MNQNNETNNKNTSEIMTVDETIAYLRVGRNSLYRLLRTGELKGFRVG